MLNFIFLSILKRSDGDTALALKTKESIISFLILNIHAHMPNYQIWYLGFLNFLQISVLWSVQACLIPSTEELKDPIPNSWRCYYFLINFNLSSSEQERSHGIALITLQRCDQFFHLQPMKPGYLYWCLPEINTECSETVAENSV